MLGDNFSSIGSFKGHNLVLIKTSIHSDCIFRITLNNPSHHNVLSEEMMSDIQSILDKSITDKSIRVIIISSEGKTLCAGHDLKQLKKVLKLGNISFARNLYLKNISMLVDFLVSMRKLV